MKYIKEMVKKLYWKWKLWHMDYQWRQRAGDLYSLIPPSYYYIYTPEEIKKMKREMVDSIRAILEEEEQADGQKDTEKI